MNQLISIIIPVYNHAHTLEKCVRSLIAQTYRPLEIIIVNDGSTDNFLDTKNKITALDLNNVTLKFFEQANQGAPAARNHGFHEATGSLIMFYDADTLAEPTMLEKLKETLDKHPEASFAYSQFTFGWKLMKSQPFNADDLKKQNYIDTMSLVRLGALPPTPFDESLKRFQDWDLWLTLLEQGKTGVFVPEVLRRVQVARPGMSRWLPSFAYKLPWKSAAVKKYEQARDIIYRKHKLL